jgi:hypothetical protein
MHCGPVSVFRRRPVSFLTENRGTPECGNVPVQEPCSPAGVGPLIAAGAQPEFICMGQRLTRRAADAAPVSTLCRQRRPNCFACDFGRAVSSSRSWLLGHGLGVRDRSHGRPRSAGALQSPTSCRRSRESNLMRRQCAAASREQTLSRPQGSKEWKVGSLFRRQQRDRACST